MSRTVAASDVFQAIACPTRRRLLEMLRYGAQPAGALSMALAMTQPAISQQLRVLKEAGLVDEQPHGRHRLYSLSAAPLKDVMSWLRSYEEFWNERLDDLGRVLDETD